jgi:NadR type nicotinamide-nucleotide adenylyltransferase
MIRGLVLGKFLPPHAGHVHLCEVASRLCDELTIVVASLAREPIAGAQRVAWLRELVPGARVVHLAAELPQQPADDPAFWPKWRAALRDIVHPDRVFTSDAYGERLAAELGARWIPVDPARATFPISGTQIRADPHAHWDLIPRCVRPHFVRRVSVFGPESTGKSTLAARLARRANTVCVPEFARTYLEARRGDLVRDDLDLIADGQAALEDSLARDATRTLICDTDPLLTVVWAETLYGPAPALRARALARRYDLTLLCDVDLPWVPDVVRYLPERRAEFFARCEQILRDAGRRYEIVRGDRARVELT